MGFKLIVQLILVITSIAIFVTFVKPAYGDIQQTQDQLQNYSETLSKETQLNQQLQSLVQQSNSFSQSELQKLDTYLPSTIDTVKVMKDIKSIVASNGGGLQKLEVTPLPKNNDGVIVNGKKIINNSLLNYRQFNLTFNASYDTMKKIVHEFELNDYALEIVKMHFSTQKNQDAQNPDTSGEGNMQYTLTLRAYSLPPLTN